MFNRTLLFSVLAASTVAFAQTQLPSLSITKELSIGGPGRWDYVTVDPASHALYVTRTTHTQVIDPATGRVIADINGGQGLHGTALVPSVSRAFVTDGKGAKLLVIDTKTNALLGTIEAAEDADGAIYDAGTDLVLVSCGDANQLIVLDPHAELTTAKVEKIDLGGKPEFLAANGQGKAFVCLNDKNLIAVVDIKARKVVDRWPTGSGTGPTGLALDARHNRLFVGCRNDKAVVLDTTAGKPLAELPIGHGNDACLFDAETNRAFASGSDGTLTVIEESSPGTFAVLQTIKTKTGSRTAGLDPVSHQIFVPAVNMSPAADGKRPSPVPDSFSILVIGAQNEKK